MASTTTASSRTYLSDSMRILVQHCTRLGAAPRPQSPQIRQALGTLEQLNCDSFEDLQSKIIALDQLSFLLADADPELLLQIAEIANSLTEEIRRILKQRAADSPGTDRA